MYECPKCQDEMEYQAGLTNIHFTGDDKSMRVLRCQECRKDFLEVSMDAWLSYGENYFTFAIELSDSESSEFVKLMQNCPGVDYVNTDECCPAHDILDRFDTNNMDRRIIIKDETIYYKSHSRNKELIKAIMKEAEAEDFFITSEHDRFSDLAEGPQGIILKLEWAQVPVKVSFHALRMLEVLGYEEALYTEIFLTLCLEIEKEKITVETVNSIIKIIPTEERDMESLHDNYLIDDTTSALDIKEFWVFISGIYKVRYAVMKLKRSGKQYLNWNDVKGVT